MPKRTVPAKDVEEKVRPKKPPGYRKFEKILKLVINAPPLHREHKQPPNAESGAHSRS